MNHCDKCNVDIVDNVNHCPLCGRNVSKEHIATESFECYPDNKTWQSKRNLVTNIFLFVILIGSIISTFLDLFLHKTITYSPFVWTGAGLAILDIILPIKKYWSFPVVSTVCAISIVAYILFLELFTGTFGWGLNYVIPFFLLFMTIYSCIIIWTRNYFKGFEFVIPLMIFCIMSIAIFFVNYFCGFVAWPALSVAITSLVLFVFILIFRFKKVQQEFHKSFFA